MRRGQLKLKAGVTTMRLLGDGYYALDHSLHLAPFLNRESEVLMSFAQLHDLVCRYAGILLAAFREKERQHFLQHLSIRTIPQACAFPRHGD